MCTAQRRGVCACLRVDRPPRCRSAQRGRRPNRRRRLGNYYSTIDDVFIIGAGATPCGRYLETSPRELARQAAEAALADAALRPDQINAIVVGNAVAGLIGGQECIRGQAWLQGTELLGTPIFNVENACASGSSAFHLACQGIGSGTYEIALVVGVEKLTHEDKARSFAALEGALDVEAHPLEKGGRQRSIFMDIYASKARRYLESHGATREDLARVVSKNRAHARLNPVAQYREELTVDEVLSAREIVDPLTLPMCAPIGDGAAALVVTTRERARGRESAVRVAGTAGSSGKPGSGSAVERAAQAAYEHAGIGPESIGIAEVHDAAASAELEEIEHLGLAGSGEAFRLTNAGETSLGGAVPVNVSGGLISRGHPVGATGTLQLYELTTQLRGRAGDRQVDPRPDFGVAQNGGGFIVDDVAAAMVTILAAA
ncbi:MAG: thiolase family protein [Actinomycetia bacterium]|nr:thiolase family protein [Actinomycetes bacterium]